VADVAAHNQTMEMIMSTNHSNTASDWFGHAEMPDWTKQIGDTVRTVFEAIDTGRAAMHDYRKLAVHGIAPQDAGKAVFQKHFGKR
jgi:hypothetical protein